MIRILLALTFAAFSTLAWAGATPPATSASATTPTTTTKQRAALPVTGQSVLAKLDHGAPLRVGVAINAPWVAHDKDGQLIGYSVDVARKLAADMGWKLELVSNSWPDLIHGLRTNQYDVIISGLSITPQRARSVLFSQVMGEHDIDVVVNRHKLQATDLAGLAKDTSARIAVLKGTRTAAVAKTMLPGAQLVEVDDIHKAIADLRAGKIDALVAEAPTPALLQKLYPDDLLELSPAVGRSAHGVAVRLGDRDLRDVLDAWIIDAKASGWLQQRADYWFNGTAWSDQL